MASCGTFQKLSPLSLLSHLSSSYDSAYLKVSSGSIYWSIYLEEGEVTYASHSIAPSARLDYHLHRLSHKIPKITSEVRTKLSSIFAQELEIQSSNKGEIPAGETSAIVDSEYQAIGWLFQQQYLNPTQLTELIQGLIAEVIESFILIKSGSYEFGNNLEQWQAFCKFPLQPIINKSQARLQAWESLGPQIWSPYQRLYFSNSYKQEQQITPVNQQISSFLKGFSFRHLAAILNQDELQLAQSLHQHIRAGTIFLQDPYPPFDSLPKTFSGSVPNQIPTSSSVATPVKTINNSNERTVIPSVSSFNNNRTIIQIPPQKVEKVNFEQSQLPPQAPQKVEKVNFEQSQLPPQAPQKVEKVNFEQSQIPPQAPQKVEINFSTARQVPQTPSQKVEKVNFNQSQPTPQAPQKVAQPEIVERAERQNRPPVNPPPAASNTKGTYKIVCVDDSPAILQELNRCLEDELFSVFTISNPIKALMQIIRIKPDLIMLDVNMAGIDGYELCRLLRNHSLFKHTPIIMVTGNKGIINRVKAKMVGSSGYITKPFTQSDLLKMVFKYLS